MRQWTRWQDWVALIAGAYAALSPIWTETVDKATWTMAVLGAVIAVVSVWSLAMPADRVSEYIHAVLGVLLFISPWAMQFTDLNALAVTAWVTGAITFVMGVWAIPEVSERLHVAHR